MKLPQIDVYSLPVTLPSSNTVISMRPYLVREEKLILMAQESNDYEQQAEAVAQIIRNCTNGTVEPKLSPFFDIEYLLLQLRARSVGEVATPIYVCHNPTGTNEDGTKTLCNNKTPIKVPIADIKVNNTSGSPTVIQLSDRYRLQLKYPTIYTVNQMFHTTVNEIAVSKPGAINALTDLFDSLEDLKESLRFDFADYSNPDKIEFLESLTPSDLEKLIHFLEAMPTLKYEFEYTCSACQFKHVVKLSGLSDFLAWGLGTTPL